MVLTHDMLFKGNFNYIVTYSKVMLLLLLSHPVMSDPLWPHGLHHIRPSCPSPSPGVCPSSCLLHWWCRPAISSSDAPFSFCPQSFPASGLFQWVVCSHQMTKILVLQLQHQSFQWIIRVDLPEDWLVWSPCCPRNFWKSSLAPQASILQRSAFFEVQLSQP